MSKTETTELVRLARQGDKQAFNRLVLLYQTRIYNLALGYVKQQDEASDLTQDIFVTVYRRLDRLRDESKFTAWLYQVAINHCRNRYNRLQRRGFFSSQSIDDPDSPLQLQTEETPEKTLEQKNRNRLLREAIAEMPAAEKEILMLRDLHELSYEEIGALLGIPLGTVKSKLNRSRLALKQRLKGLF